MDKVDKRLEKMTPLQRAVFALKETQARLDALEQQRDEPIAIVGMACRFPGGANDLASYWRLLCDGVDAIGETPPDRWNVDAFYDPDPATSGKMHSRNGGFLDRIDTFDNHFFGISDREAELIDPQQRLLLELSWEALEDAGLPPSRLRGSRTGVFVGLANSDYAVLLFRCASQSCAYASTGVSPSIAANRISFAFDLCGPSLTMDTACSSSLVAMHLACQSIRNGDSEAALVGAVNLMLSPVPTINLGKSGFLAADGRVRAFDANASGYVRGEGAGVVVLKPLSAALRSGDSIYAVIRGSAVSQNGASNGLTAPRGQAQEEALRRAYAQAGVSPGRVQYVETHGTGTQLGDPIEAIALGSVLRQDRPSGSRCAIGSVKTNIGHLEAAAGMASIIKVALALKHGQLPPTLHYETPNPDIPFDELPLTVQQSLAPWPDCEEPRLAGVSGFGFGGSNAHFVLEEAPQPAAASSPMPVPDAQQICLLPLSARTEQALEDLARKYLVFLQDSPPRWSEVCTAAAVGREHHDCRLAVVAASHRQAVEQLEAYLAGEFCPGVFAGRRPVGRDPKIAFVFAGRADGWAPYGQRMARMATGLREALDEVDAVLQQAAGWPLSTMFGEKSQWSNPVHARATVVALQRALASWFRSLGVIPGVVVGQGAGELAAACTAGMLSTAEAIQMATSNAGGDTSAVLRNDSLRPATLPVLSCRNGSSHGERVRGSTQAAPCDDPNEDLSGTIQSLRSRGVDCCLEIGPAALTERIAQLANNDEPALVTIASLGPLGEESDGVLPAVAALYAAGASLRWDVIAPSDGCRVSLPQYPWQRQRLWALERNPFLAGEGDASHAVETGAAGVDADRPTQVSVGGPLDDAEIRPRPVLNTPYAAPRTPLEEQMARSWSEILSIERVGVHDDFFELGGDSLQATVLLNRLQEQVGQEVDAHVLFQCQTIDTLATHLRNHYSSAIGRLYPAEYQSSATSPHEDQAVSGPPADVAIPRLSRDSGTEEMLSRLDQLTDEEVKALLNETLAESESENE